MAEDGTASITIEIDSSLPKDEMRRWVIFLKVF